MSPDKRTFYLEKLLSSNKILSPQHPFQQRVQVASIALAECDDWGFVPAHGHKNDIAHCVTILEMAGTAEAELPSPLRHLGPGIKHATIYPPTGHPVPEAPYSAQDTCSHRLINEMKPSKAEVKKPTVPGANGSEIGATHVAHMLP